MSNEKDSISLDDLKLFDKKLYDKIVAARRHAVFNIEAEQSTDFFCSTENTHHQNLQVGDTINFSQSMFSWVGEVRAISADGCLIRYDGELIYARFARPVSNLTAEEQDEWH